MFNAFVRRELLLTDGHLSAASGLVVVGQQLYVVADDENSLGVFELGSDAAGRLVTIFEGELPMPHKLRKAAKADLEALTRLPPAAELAGYPHGALLALGSGSRRNRQRAALIGLDANGRLDSSPPREIDLRVLFEPLAARFGDLNIEGVFVDGPQICLLQRGNNSSPVNACVRYDCAAFERALCGVAVFPSVVSITEFELGRIDGVVLGFTDGAALPDGRWVFCAAAEDTSDSYADGRCVGSVVGVVDASGVLRQVESLSVPSFGVCKVEGIGATLSGNRIELLLVTDADDRRRPALLLSATLTLPA